MTEEKQPIEAAAPAEEPPEPRWLFYAISFFIPLAGIILGSIFLSKPDAASREFGKYCLVAALVNFAIGFSIFCCIIMFYVSFFLGYIAFVLGLMGVAIGGSF